MGAFDDLLPQQPAASSKAQPQQPQAGAFDDLLPEQPASAAQSQFTGTFDDLLPEDEHIPEQRAIDNYNDATTIGERAANDLRRGWLNLLQSGTTHLLRERDPTRAAMASVLASGQGGGMYAANLPYSPDERIDATKQDLAATLVERGKELQSIPQRPVVKQMSNAETFGEAVDAALRDPLGAIAGTTFESLPQMAPGLAIAPINPIMGAGMMGATSGIGEMESTVLEFMREQGVDFNDPKAVAAAFENPELLSAAEKKGLTRGAIIGTIDALSSGLASKALPIKHAATREAVNIPAQIAAQGGAGGGGEALAQIATEGEVTQPGAVVAEMVGEAGGAPVEVAAFSANRARDAVAARREQRIIDAVRKALAEEDAQIDVQQPAAPQVAPQQPAQPTPAPQQQQTQAQPVVNATAPVEPPTQASGAPQGASDVVDPIAETQAAQAPEQQEPADVIDLGQEPSAATGTVEASAATGAIGAELADGSKANPKEAARFGKKKTVKGPLSEHADRPVGRSFYTRVFEEAGLNPAEAELMPADKQFEVISKQLQTKYGFSSIEKEPGHNWREALDAGMDAHQNLQTMAASLGLPIKAMSLNGKISMKLTKGGDGALAWHMGLGPKGSIIGMSRRNHAYAHEWMHGLDHDILERSGARNANLVTGRLFTGKLRRGLDVSRTEPDLVEAFGELLQAMYRDDAAKAATVRTLELRLEKADPKDAPLIRKQLAAIRRNQSPESSFYQGAVALDRGKFQTPEHGSDKGYWQRPTEMFARAGEAYVARNIENMGGGTNFVSKTNMQYMRESVDFIKKAYPQQSDRERIFAAFDKLFGVVSNQQIFGTDKAPMPNTDNGDFDLTDPRVWASSEKGDPYKGMPYFKRLLAELGDLVRNEAAATRRDAAELKNRLKNTKEAFDEPMARYIERILSSSAYSGRGTLLFLKKVYPRSLAIDELFRKLITRPGTGEFSSRTYEEAVNLYVGQKGNVFQRIVHKYELGETNEQELRALRDMLAGVRTTGPTRLVEAAADIGKLLDQIWYDVEQAGIDIGYTKENYLPRLYDHSVIERKPREFVDAAKQVYEIMFADMKDPAEREAKAQAAAEDWLVRIRTGPLDNFDKNGVASSLTANRKLPAEADSLLAEFMILDPLELVQTYTLQAARRIAWADRFGADNKGLNALVEQMGQEGLRSQDIELAKMVVSIATGQRKSDLARPMQAALSWLHAVGTITLLPRAVFSSIAEPATASLRSGDVRDAFKVFANTTATLARTDNGRNLREMAEFLGIIADTLTDQMLANRFGGTFSDPKGANRLLGRFFHRTGLHGLTNAQRAAAIPIADAYMRSWAKRLLEGTTASEAVLGELGINPSHAKEFSEWLLALGRRPTIEELEQAKPLMRELYTTAINRFIDESIQNPKAVDRAVMAHNPIGRLIFGIMSFLWSFQRNVIIRTGHMFKAAYTGKYGGHQLSAHDRMTHFSLGLIPPITTMLTLHIAVSIAREALFNPDRFGDEDDDFWDKALSGESVMLGISRSGVFGAFDPILNAFAGLKYQRDLSNVMVGAVPGYFLQAWQRAVTPLTRNSPKTNTAEYNAIKGLYQLAVAPTINVALTWAPGGPILAPTYGGMMMALSSPRVSNELAEAIVGPKGEETEE